ncbi:MAG: hypothetical protein LBS27_12275 [Bifidobacteriaceae bacterium]|jgi:hypothetical protein|nr:hypothetical protein [Bifidobacteriaceae bacterium]
MPVLNVIAAPKGPAGEILDALQDLSAIGMVQPFIWLAGLDGAGLAATGSWIRDGERFTAPLDQLLKDKGQEGYDHLRVGVLVPAYPGVDQIGLQEAIELAAELETNPALSRTHAERLRVYIADPSAHPVEGIEPVLGWHNVLIDPENATSPGGGPVAWTGGADASDFGRRALPAICGLFTLWRGESTGALDGTVPPPNGGLRMIRSFHRKLDATNVVGAARQSVLSLDQGLPVSTVVGSETEAAPDPAALSYQMSKVFLADHGGDLGLGPREAIPVEEKKELGPGQTLKMFFSFLGSAIGNTVANFPQHVINKISGSVARKISNLVFGSNDPAVIVVVNGRRADGKPAGWRELGQQIASVADRMGFATTPDAVPNFGSVWKSYGGAARALADGLPRGRDSEVPLTGTKRPIIPRPAQIVPDPREDPFQLDALLAAELGLAQVQPGDVAESEDLRNRLRMLASDRVLGARAGQELARLEGWLGTVGHTFAHNVGRFIAGNLLAALAQVRAYLTEIERRERGAATSQDLADAQKRARRRILVILGIFLLGLVATVVLAVLDVLGVALAVGIGAALLIGWAVSSLLAFTSSQRDLFALANRVKTLEPALNALRRNLRQAYSDIQRLSLAYDQYLIWTAIYGEFLNRPFGRGKTAAPSPAVAPVGLPTAVQSAVVVTTPEVLAQVTATLRQGVFEPGWLEPAWEACLQSALETLGPQAAIALDGDPGRLYADRGTNSYLALWSAAVLAHGVGQRAGETVWSKAESRLGPGEALREQLVQTVQTAAGTAPESAAWFQSGLATAANRVDAANSSLLDSEAVHQRLTVFEGPAELNSQELELSSTFTLTQSTGVIPPYHVKIFPSADDHLKPDDVPEVF